MAEEKTIEEIKAEYDGAKDNDPDTDVDTAEIIDAPEAVKECTTCHKPATKSIAGLVFCDEHLSKKNAKAAREIMRKNKS